jgi:hypothetical protein
VRDAAETPGGIDDTLDEFEFAGPDGGVVGEVRGAFFEIGDEVGIGEEGVMAGEAVEQAGPGDLRSLGA